MGESYDHYRTCSVRTLADECSFATITQEEILRDRLVFGIRDAKVRERYGNRSCPWRRLMKYAVLQKAHPSN